MRAGKLDRRIVLQVNTPADDDFGVPQPSWADLATVSAEVREERGREFFEGGVTAERKRVFIIRWRNDVGQGDRVVYKSENHDIRSVRELGRREGLEIMTVVVE